jgi:hypothetical protein
VTLDERSPLTEHRAEQQAVLRRERDEEWAERLRELLVQDDCDSPRTLGIIWDESFALAPKETLTYPDPGWLDPAQRGPHS